MEPGCSLPPSHQLTTDLYPKPIYSSPHQWYTAQFHTFYRTWRFITTFTPAVQWFLSSVNSIQSTPVIYSKIPLIWLTRTRQVQNY